MQLFSSPRGKYASVFASAWELSIYFGCQWDNYASVLALTGGFNICFGCQEGTLIHTLAPKGGLCIFWPSSGDGTFVLALKRAL